MIFKIYNSDLVLTYAGVTYTFEDFDSLTVEDPESTRLTRGSNAANKSGLIYKEGAKDPKRVTAVVMNVATALYAVLTEIYETKSRVEISLIDRTDGSGKIGKNAVLCQQPQQLTIDESAESMQVQMIFDTFDLKEIHKS